MTKEFALPTRVRLLAPTERLIDAGFRDDRESGTLVVMALFVVLWTTFHCVVYSSIGLHPDLTEVYAWGRHPAWGYYKNPGLGAWVTGAWFALFPAADWAFNLLAMVNAAAALYFTDLIARRFMTGDKRLVVLLLLLCTPFLQFHGQRFGANQILLATWPLATYLFLRAFETRAVSWSIAAGAAAAAAMLGKYYSIYLVGGLILAALSHPARWRYLKSASPWLTAAAGLIVLAPHIHWLMTTGYQPFAYAYMTHASPSLAEEFINVPVFLAGCLGYAALPLLIYWIVVRPDRATLKETFWPSDPARRMLAVALAGFFLLPVVLEFPLGVLLTSLWAMPAYFLLPIVLLSPPSAGISRRATATFALAMLAFTLVAITVVAPIQAWRNFQDSGGGDRAYIKQLSRIVTRDWHNSVRQPLTIILGDAALAEAVTFYSPDHPDTAPNSNIAAAPWITRARLAGEGYAAVCRAEDTGCIHAAESAGGLQHRAKRGTIDIVPHFLGQSGVPARFTIIIVAPVKAVRHGDAGDAS